MSLASTVSLGALRLQAQQRADLVNSGAVITSEWNQYLSQSHKRLFDMLVAAYGNDYFVAPLFQFNTGSGQYYPLPNGTLVTLGGSSPAPALYKLLGVDLQYAASPSGFITLKRFEEIERNRFSLPNVAVNQIGQTNLRYRTSGSNLELVPAPMAGQTIQLKYIQKPPSLQFLPTCATTLNSASVTMSDVGDLSVGMSVYGPGVQSGSTVTAINTGTNTVTLSLAVLATQPIVTLAFWTDAVTIDGVAGWEEFVIIDAAIKAKSKQEEDTSELRIQKAEMVDDIKNMAEGRDAGQAHHVSDVLGANGYGGMDGDGFGGGYGGMGGF